VAFPTTAVLDSFDRADEGPPPSASWTSTGIATAAPHLAVISNLVRSNGSAHDGVYGTSFGPNCEVYVTVTTWAANTRTVRIYTRLAEEGNTTVDGYQASFQRDDTSTGGFISLHRVDNNTATQLGATVTDTGGVYAGGEKCGLASTGDTHEVWFNRGSWVSQMSRTDAAYAGAGHLGLRFGFTDMRGDDFGGGGVEVAAQVPITVLHGNFW